MTNPFINIIPTEAVSGVLGKDYLSTNLCSSDTNDYIPISIIPNGELIKYKSGKQVFVYSLTVPTATSSTKKLDRFCSNTVSGVTWIKLVSNRVDGMYISTNGTIITLNPKTFEIVVLLAMCVRRSELFNIKKVNNKPNQFCLLVNTHFIDNEDHYKIYRNVKKQYIDKADVDILFTRNINSLAFNPPKLVLPQLNSLDDITNHVKNICNIEVKKLIDMYLTALL